MSFRKIGNLGRDPGIFFAYGSENFGCTISCFGGKNFPCRQYNMLSSIPWIPENIVHGDSLSHFLHNNNISQNEFVQRRGFLTQRTLDVKPSAGNYSLNKFTPALERIFLLLHTIMYPCG